MPDMLPVLYPGCSVLHVPCADNFKFKANNNPRRGFDSGFTYGCGGIEELDGTEND